MNQTLCTYTKTQTTYVPQHVYNCETCGLQTKSGVCETCVFKCHQGHTTFYSHYGKFYCDCGAKGSSFCSAVSEVKEQRSTAKMAVGDAETNQVYSCPVCWTYMSPPIHMCARGHNVCGSCVANIPTCPLCKGDFTGGRNLGMESLSWALKVPCEYCHKHYVIAAMKCHMKVCEERDSKCFLESTCLWMGKVYNLYNHCIEKHADQVKEGEEHLFQCETDDKYNNVHLIDVEGILFLFDQSYDPDKSMFQVAVKYITQTKDNSKYYYTLRFSAPNDTESLQFKKMVRPMFEDITDIYNLNYSVNLLMYQLAGISDLGSISYILKIAKY